MPDLKEQNKKVSEELTQKSSQKKRATSPMEAMDNINKVTEDQLDSQKFFMYAKSNAVNEAKNYGQLPLRTYEMLRNKLIGIN